MKSEDSLGVDGAGSLLSTKRKSEKVESESASFMEEGSGGSAFAVARCCGRSSCRLMALLICTLLLVVFQLLLQMSQLNPQCQSEGSLQKARSTLASMSSGVRLNSDACAVKGQQQFDERWRAVCHSQAFQWFAPFRFIAEFRKNENSGVSKYGVVACEWPTQTWIMRVALSSCAVLSILVALESLHKISTLTGDVVYKWQRLYKLVRATFALLSACVFAVFVLAVDDMRTGFDLCRSKFKVDGRKIVELKEGWSLTECRMDPFIFLSICDFLVFGHLFWCYLSMKFYVIPPAHRRYNTPKTRMKHVKVADDSEDEDVSFSDNMKKSASEPEHWDTDVDAAAYH